jgi:transketolase
VSAEVAVFPRSRETLQEAFGKALVSLAGEFPKLVVLDSGSPADTGSRSFRHAHGERSLQFGAAPQNTLAAASGLAAVGMLPVATGLAANWLRAIEQARFAVAYAGRNVKIVGSRAGVDAGSDGAPVQAVEDIAAFRAIPGMTVISPADSVEMTRATRAMLEFDGPVYLRAGRSPSATVFDENHTFAIGRGEIVRNGTDVTIVACGIELSRALEAATILAAENIDARVVNMATIKPIDTKLLVRCADVTGAIVTAEDHNVVGGLGGAVAEALARTMPCPIECVGIQDTFGTCGEAQELAAHFGIAASDIAAAAKRAIARKIAR